MNAIWNNRYAWVAVIVGLTACSVYGRDGGARRIAEWSWPELEAQGKVMAGEVVDPGEGQPSSVLRLSHDGTAERTFKVLTLDRPAIETAQYALRGRIRCVDVEGQGYLEMWTHLPGKGKFFSRTLAHKGPGRALTGTQDWRPFVLPFLATDKKLLSPSQLDVNVVLPGKGTIEIASLELVDYATRAAAVADASGSTVGWWSDTTGGLLGGFFGLLIGLAGAAVGLLAWRGQALPLALGLLKLIQVFGIVALAVGIVALIGSQPYAVYYPLILCGVLCTVIPLLTARGLRRQYQAMELRKMAAMDSAGT